MSNFADLLDTFRNNLKAVLAAAMLILVVLGDVFFAATAVFPEWGARAQLEAAQDSAEGAINQALQAQSAMPGRLQSQIDEMRGRLDERAAIFVSISQANEILNRLFLYATESGVEIVEIEAATSPRQPDEETAQGYEVSAFSLRVLGESRQLMLFTSRIDETRIPGVVITQMVLEEGNGLSVLTLDLLLYTSDYAADVALAEPTDYLSTPEPEDSSASLPLISNPAANPTPGASPVCDCSANLYNCRDFPDRPSAQICYDFCGGPANDVHRLDADLNGVVCQTVYP